MFKCSMCGKEYINANFPIHCKCGGIHISNDTTVDALASNQPGTELERLIKGDIKLGPFHFNIALLGRPPKKGCNCQDRIDLMNGWGVNGCVKNRDTIIQWVQESAIREGVHLPRIFYAKLVDLAIHNASIR